MDNMICSTPGVGHIRGGIAHLAASNREEEERAKAILNQASRTTVVAGAGIGGFFLGGPVGAAILAGGAGTEYDLIASAITDKPRGVGMLVDAIGNKKTIRSGDFFDAVTAPLLDAGTGVTAARIFTKVQAAVKGKKQISTLEKNLEEQGVKNPKQAVGEMRKKAGDLQEKVSGNSEELTKLQEGVDKNRAKRYAKLEKKNKPIPAKDPNAATNNHTSCTMEDSRGNRSTGYSSRLTSAMGIDRNIIGKLQGAFPEIKACMGRALNACAEHMAYEGIIPEPVVTFAIQIRDGMVYAVDRCKNCAQYPLGKVITDGMNGSWIPEPGYCSDALTGAASGTGLLILTIKRDQKTKKQ